MNVEMWTRMARYLAGEMNTPEEIKFRNEVQEDPQMIKELEKMERTWKNTENLGSGGRKDSAKAWEKLHNRLSEDGLLDVRETAGPKRRISAAWRMAAAILLILGVGIPATYYGLLQNGSDSRQRHHTAEQGVNTVDLPDGSRVYLNEGAEITYPARFKQERSVSLKGEAFFEVMSDPANPFTVSSGKITVSVLGTSFNVKGPDTSGEVEVFVESGRVRMSVEDTNRSISLGPGEMGHQEETGLTRTEQRDPNYISWKTKDFKFVDVDLMEVLRELEESYHVEIRANAALIGDMRITTTYSEQSIDAILETIGAAFGLTVNAGEDGYYLTN